MGIEKLRIVAVRPDEQPVIEEIDSGVKAMQAVVGGYLTYVPLVVGERCIDLWCNEDGLHTCEPNRLLPCVGGRMPIYGSFFIVACQGCETVSLTEAEAEFWQKFAATLPFALLAPKL